METPPSDQDGHHANHALMRDISRRGRAAGGSLTSEQQLMRLANDPLLVRDFLHRQDAGGSIIPATRFIPEESAIALAHAGQPQGGCVMSAGLPKSGYFEACDKPYDSSIFPSAFRPTAADRRMAFEHEPLHRRDGGEARNQRHALAGAIKFISVLILLLLLFIPS
jgi:hypothetical protein